MKPHELNKKELSQLIALTKFIRKEAKKRGVELSKNKAKKLAIKHLGFIDTDDYAKLQEENGKKDVFLEGIKTALPKYRNL